MNTLALITKLRRVRRQLITAAAMAAIAAIAAGCGLDSIGEALLKDQEGKRPNTTLPNDTSSNNRGDESVLIGDWELDEDNTYILTFGEDGGLGNSSGAYIKNLPYDSTRWRIDDDTGLLLLLGLNCHDAECLSYDTAYIAKLAYELLNDNNTLRITDADNPDAERDVWTRRRSEGEDE